MTDEARRDLELGEDDSLPWLETADDYDQEDGPSAGKVIGLVLGGLLLLGLIAGGIYLLQMSGQRSRGSGELIAAQEGNYKVAPADPQGKTFEGEGDAAFAASEGKTRESNVMPAKAARPTANASGSAKVPSSSASSSTAGAQGGAKALAAAPAGDTGGVLVQLAALGSETAAEQQWSALTGRYAYLKDMRHRVVAAQVEGRTVYRLSAVSSDKAKAGSLCAQIKSDGGNCLIVG